MSAIKDLTFSDYQALLQQASGFAADLASCSAGGSSKHYAIAGALPGDIGRIVVEEKPVPDLHYSLRIHTLDGAIVDRCDASSGDEVEYMKNWWTEVWSDARRAYRMRVEERTKEKEIAFEAVCKLLGK